MHCDRIHTVIEKIKKGENNMDSKEDLAKQLELLMKRNRELEEENEILKKAIPILLKKNEGEGESDDPDFSCYNF
nr:MAG TPA: Trimeric autotransporter adhesin, trimeric autotransporter adhesin, TAA.97A [Caudoviricetes sp.]